jgi:hypothetical protein
MPLSALMPAPVNTISFFINYSGWLFTNRDVIAAYPFILL